MIEKVEEFARSQGKEIMCLHTAERLVNTRKLYEKVGYTLENVTESIGFTVMIYKKDLIK